MVSGWLPSFRSSARPGLSRSAPHDVAGPAIAPGRPFLARNDHSRSIAGSVPDRQVLDRFPGPEWSVLSENDAVSAKVQELEAIAPHQRSVEGCPTRSRARKRARKPPIRPRKAPLLNRNRKGVPMCLLAESKR